jgi:hypothetical protein
MFGIITMMMVNLVVEDNREDERYQKVDKQQTDNTE